MVGAVSVVSVHGNSLKTLFGELVEQIPTGQLRQRAISHIIKDTKIAQISHSECACTR